MRWNRSGMIVDLAMEDGHPVHIRGLAPDRSPRPVPGDRPPGVPLIELDRAGAGRVGVSAGAQHRLYAAGRALRYAGHEWSPDGATLVVHQRDESGGLAVATTLWQAGGLPVVRIVHEVSNIGSAAVELTYVSSLSLTGFGAGLDELRLHQARNAWSAELRWQHLTPEQAGLVEIGPHRGTGTGSGTETATAAATGTGTGTDGTSRGRYPLTVAGSWSSVDFLPMGGIENVRAGVTWAWQIEHNGGWHWEAGDVGADLYLAVSGPTGREHRWRHRLAPGERFTTVPVAIAVTPGDLTDGLRALTGYRRAIRRPVHRPAADPGPGDESLPIIFNDYMNCLMGDPTEEKLAPLIAAAAEVGAEYFVIDAGWYADDGGWWSTVGEWEPSPVRFPNGLPATVRRIRDAGMVAGLWLEPEVVGIHSPTVDKLPAAAFLREGGEKRQENGRFHLDYRDAEVRTHMDDVVDRLVRDYGIGYLKLDYNIDVGPVPGLLGHNRAYLSWLDGLRDRHPALVLENCASGGMRMDYALLSRMNLQSTSDQTDHIRYAAIAAAAPSAVTPEQGAVWAYPQPDHTPEEASFCLVNALLGRVHLSGRIDLMNAGQRARVRAALDVYRRIRPSLARGVPRWPLGLPGWHDTWLTLAIDAGTGTTLNAHNNAHTNADAHTDARTNADAHTDADGLLLAVWYRGSGPGTTTLPIAGAAGRSAEVLFPADLPTEIDLTRDTLRLTVPDGPAARLIRLH